MKFQINKDKLIVKDEKSLNSGSVNYYEVECEFDESWNELTKEAILIKKDETEGISIAVINNRIFIDEKTFGFYAIGFVGYTIENEEKVYQISTNLERIYFNKGAGELETTNSQEVPTPTEWEIYIAQIQEMVDGLEEQIPTKLSELENDNNTVQDEFYTHTDNNFSDEDKEKIDSIINYSLITETGSRIDLEINSTTYILVAKLYDKNNNLISTSSEIDLPIESVIVNGYYDSLNKKIVLVLNNGNTIDIPVGDLVSGLQTEITNDNKLSSDLVDDTNKTNKFVTNTEKSNWDAKYDKPNSGIPKTDMSSEVQTSLGKADTAIQEHQDISMKQDIEDNTLTTNNKTVPGAINEVNSIAKGANQALSYGNYSTMVTAFNALGDDVYNVGQNVMIITLEVPDLWISGIESTSVPYTYVDDATIVNALQTDGYIQVGYYRLSMLETQKVDLTNYVQNTDYATENKGGVIKTGYGLLLFGTGQPYAYPYSYNTYINPNIVSNYTFISKGTLENVITGKDLTTKAYVDGLVGNLEDILEELDIGGGVE